VHKAVNEQTSNDAVLQDAVQVVDKFKSRMYFV